MHLAETRATWPSAVPGATAAATAASTESVLAAVEQTIDAFAEGFERAQRLTVRREEAARREFIDDLLYGRSDLGKLAERATRFGLRLSRAHAVAVAAGPEAYTETDAVPRQVESALLARFGGRKILLTTKDGRMICIAPGNQPDVLRYFAKQAHAATDGGRVAVGRAHRGPGGVVQSYDEALDALDLADRMGLDDPVLYSADLLVYPVLTRDRQAMADLVRSELGPLQQARGGAEPLLKTLTVYFDMRLCRGRDGPAPRAERAGADVPAGADPPAHRLRPVRPGAPLHPADRGDRGPAAGLAGQGDLSPHGRAATGGRCPAVLRTTASPRSPAAGFRQRSPSAALPACGEAELRLA